MITVTKGHLSQEAGLCWSRANYKGGEIVTYSSRKGFLYLGGGDRTGRKGPGVGSGGLRTGVSQHPLLGHRPASGASVSVFLGTNRGQESTVIEMSEKGEKTWLKTESG